MDLRKATSRKNRLETISQEIHTDLSVVDTVFIDDESYVHCENLIGAVSIPLGLAGPMDVIQNEKHTSVYIPLATTEGALVASVSRGAKASSASGGIHTVAEEAGTTRGPVFYTHSLAQKTSFIHWLHEHEKEIAKVAESTSKHLTYRSMSVQSSGLHVFVRFAFDTDQAMGMNMVTIATQQIVEYISTNTHVICLAVAGNYDVDKKPSWMNMICGRGQQAWAECTLSANVLSTILKTDAQQLYNVWIAKCMLGSAMSGSMGYNAHFANIVAAMFAATGQDLAHVVEGSMGITYMEHREQGSLYISVYLPSLMIGTVGGGTSLKTQSAARSIMGDVSKKQFAEYVAGALLCGEISLLASLSAGTLSSAHKALGR